jgi:hypothetical protein
MILVLLHVPAKAIGRGSWRAAVSAGPTTGTPSREAPYIACDASAGRPVGRGSGPWTLVESHLGAIRCNGLSERHGREFVRRKRR